MNAKRLSGLGNQQEHWIKAYQVYMLRRTSVGMSVLCTSTATKGDVSIKVQSLSRANMMKENRISFCEVQPTRTSTKKVAGYPLVDISWLLYSIAAP